MNTVEGWKRSILSDQLELIRNGYSGQQVGQVTNFPVSRIETISNGTIDQSKVGYVNFIPDSYLLKPGDILFSNINSLKHIGKVAQVSNEIRLFHGMNLLVLRPVIQVDKKFLFYKLVNAKTWFEKMAAQAINQASINQETLRNLKLELPTEKREQTKIAEIISTVDQAIEQTEALIAKQQRIKIGLMQDLLTRGIDEHGNLRSEETHEFKDFTLGRIPVDWDPKHLREVADYQNGKAFPSSAYCDSGVRLVRPGNLAPNGLVVWDNAHTTHLPSSFWKKARDYHVGPREILMNLTAQSLEDQFLGRVCMTPEGNSCLLNQRIARIVPHSCDPNFLFWSFKGPHFRNYVDSIPQGTKVQHIYDHNLNEVQLAIPKSKIEQELIASILWEIEHEIDAYLNQLDKLRSLKIGLMQDLLTGKKRVTALLNEKEVSGV